MPIITWSFIDRESTVSKVHSKTIVFSCHDRQALGVFETSANMSTAGLGLDIFEGQHPRLASTESGQLSTFPLDTPQAIQAIHVLEADLRGKERSGLVVPNDAFRPARSEDLRQAGVILAQATAKVKQYKKIHNSSRLDERKKRAIGYSIRAESRDMLTVPRLEHVLRLTTDVIETVNDTKIELPTKPRELTEAAQESQRRLLASLPSVGTNGTVICLCCKS